jgi:hypothetical protein
MGFWNYRVFRETYINGTDRYTIREVHYLTGQTQRKLPPKG